MKIAIIDDDLIFAQGLNQYISQLSTLKNTICSVSNVSPCYAAGNTKVLMDYDVIFLDIEMPEINGISLAENINCLRGLSSTPYIIFVTAKDNLVFDALKMFPYSFIRKSHLDDIETCLQNLSGKISRTPTYSIKNGRIKEALDDLFSAFKKAERYGRNRM